MKKTTSLLLAFALAFALTIPAFASGSVTVTGETIAPTITVTMPLSVVVGLNPYGMTYAGTSPFLKTLKDSSDQILSVAALVENKSDSKLSVSAEATATVTTGDASAAAADKVKLVNTGVTNGKFDAADVTKSILLKIQIGQAETDGSWSGTEPTAVTFKPDSSNTAEGKAFYGIDKTDPANPAAITIDDADNGKLKAVEIPVPEGAANYIGFKFSGAVNDHPDKAWAAGDTLGAVVAFTFKPMSNISAS